MNAVEIAQSLFTAFENNDLPSASALCHPNLVAQQNGGPRMGRDDVLGLSKAVSAVIPDFRYENPIRSATADGFVEEHDVCGTLPDGSELRMAVCVVAVVEDGQITQMREYLDSRAASGLLKAVSGK